MAEPHSKPSPVLSDDIVAYPPVNGYVEPHNLCRTCERTISEYIEFLGEWMNPWGVPDTGMRNLSLETANSRNFRRIGKASE